KDLTSSTSEENTETTVSLNEDVTVTNTEENIIVPEGMVPVYYTVKKNESLLGIADMFNSRVSDIRNWNNIPYTTTIRVGQKLTVYVPEDKKDFYASLDTQTPLEKTTTTVSTTQNSSNSLIYHRIRRGETLNSIAKRYNVSITSIKEWNDLSGTKIYAGRNLKIYTDQPVSHYASDDDVSTHGTLYRYRVKRGDTISELAEKFGVPSSMIRKWNNISGNKLIAGKTIKIYTNESSSLGDNTTKTSSNVIYHKIKPGETISQIAELYKVSSSNIRKWNGLRSNKIIAGKTLKVYSDANIYDLPETVSTKPNGKTHVVKSGESLYSI